MKIAVYDNKGTKKNDLEIKSDIFKVSGKQILLSEVIVSYLANMRLAQPKTKKRGEVSGGGKKPWKQKGTGRARVGSNRTPVWIGGGNVFGPVGNENHKRIIPATKKRTALKAALTEKANEILALDSLGLKNPKTKEVAAVVKNLPVDGKMLFIFDEKEEANVINKSFSNLPNVKTAFYKNLNAYDVLNGGSLVFVGSSLEETVKFLEG